MRGPGPTGRGGGEGRGEADEERGSFSVRPPSSPPRDFSLPSSSLALTSALAEGEAATDASMDGLREEGSLCTRAAADSEQCRKRSRKPAATEETELFPEPAIEKLVSRKHANHE